MKGFSIIEVIISLAVAGILLAIVTNSFQVAQIKKNQQQITQTILSSLEEQKVNTQAGKNAQSYGVKFNTSEFILFSGTAFASSSQNKVVAIDPRFEITETISNSQNIIYFSKLIGDSNEVATVTVSHISNRIPPQHVVIEKSGTISVVE
jgi:prepilin-type N-terminal cleavage/methylation domain-containing protein